MGVNLLVRSVKFFGEEFTAVEQIGKNAVFNKLWQISFFFLYEVQNCFFKVNAHTIG